jgi:hypothetical protein
MEGAVQVNAGVTRDGSGSETRPLRQRAGTFSWGLIHFSLGIPLALVYTKRTHGNGRLRTTSGHPGTTRKR